MSDLKLPDSMPCKYDEGNWHPCKKPTDNGWCTKHENITCVSCGQKAIHSCDAGMGGLCCGSPLCATCRHDHDSGSHITIEAHTKKKQEVANEEKLLVASRTSPFQRIHPELNVPYNLFELLKGDFEKDGYVLKTLYFLELKHGLMGFYPAVFDSDRKRIIFTENLSLLEQVWNLLPPREAIICQKVSYVNSILSIGYIITDDVSQNERVSPIIILSVTEFESLMETESPFDWAYGLLGRDMQKEAFDNNLIEQARKISPRFESHKTA